MTNDNEDSLSTPAPAHGLNAGTGEPWGRSTDGVAGCTQHVTGGSPAAESSPYVTAPDLVAFVTERLDEREALARAATGHPIDAKVSDAGYAHLRQFDTANVLREVTAMRAIVARYSALDPLYDYEAHEALGWVVEYLAAIWTEHEDYRAEWAP